MAKFEHHIFICQNTRPPGHPRGSCNEDEKSELVRLFKEALNKSGLQGKVRSNKSGCLDQCEHGPMVVIYPDAVWYGNVANGDVYEIVQALAENKIVDRLALKDACINTASCEHKPKKST